MNSKNLVDIQINVLHSIILCFFMFQFFSAHESDDWFGEALHLPLGITVFPTSGISITSSMYCNRYIPLLSSTKLNKLSICVRILSSSMRVIKLLHFLLYQSLRLSTFFFSVTFRKLRVQF